MSLKIPGVKLNQQETEIYQSRIAELLNLHKYVFPGAQPVSFQEKHTKELLSKNYFVSEKADGIRLLLFATIYKIQYTNDWKPIMILIDRKNEFYKLENCGFPSSNSNCQWLLDTVLDGELVFDSQKKKMYLLLFDALMVDGKLLVKRPYTSRLGYLREIVLKPYLAKLKSNRDLQKFNSQLEIRQKKIEPCYKLDRVFKDVKEYAHSNDGLMFTDSEAKYTVGTCEAMVKWKPPEENTVDFLLHVVKSAVDAKDEYFIMVNYGNKGYQIESKFVFGEDLDKIKGEKLHGRIIECKYDKNWPFKWRFSRFRDDKTDANHISTFQKVLNSIEDNVTKEKLLEIRGNIESFWKERELLKTRVPAKRESLSQEQQKQQRQEPLQLKESEVEQNQKIQGSTQAQKEKDETHDTDKATLSEKELLSVDFD